MIKNSWHFPNKVDSLWELLGHPQFFNRDGMVSSKPQTRAPNRAYFFNVGKGGHRGLIVVYVKGRGDELVKIDEFEFDEKRDFNGSLIAQAELAGDEITYYSGMDDVILKRKRLPPPLDISTMSIK